MFLQGIPTHDEHKIGIHMSIFISIQINLVEGLRYFSCGLRDLVHIEQVLSSQKVAPLMAAVLCSQRSSSWLAVLWHYAVLAQSAIGNCIKQH
jgi:hypothetical protein